MGAVTALLYAAGKAPDAAALICDSPFASIKRLCHDLVHKASRNVPDAAVTLAVRKIRRSVKYRTKFDIYKVRPERAVATCKAPALLVHAVNDDFIRPEHSDDIAKRYGGHCTVLHPFGNHNAKRTRDVFQATERFLARALLADPDKQSALDFDGFDHPAVPNPYLLPPWAFISDDRHPDTLRVNAALFDHASPARPPHPRDPDADFVSGMSDARQKQTETAVAGLFGAARPAAP
mmetsp:Transcript_7811/g.23914  ORF Transcript_7811/g.23914 Transcript_7811/m.23914 type:complete len:235 (-) Transcript_7811:696-1400(-)